MTRIVYISGRYRWKKPDGSWDTDRMEMELADEYGWEELIIRAGHIPIPPLRLTVPHEQTIILPAAEWIRRDLRLISTLDAARSLILMRAGWQEIEIGQPRPDWYPDGLVRASQGATEEHECAMERQMHAMAGSAGEAIVREYLERLLEAGVAA